MHHTIALYKTSLKGKIESYKNIYQKKQPKICFLQTFFFMFLVKKLVTILSFVRKNQNHVYDFVHVINHNFGDVQPDYTKYVNL